MDRIRLLSLALECLRLAQICVECDIAERLQKMAADYAQQSLAAACLDDRES